ncbi:hypothetical protein Q5424_27735 [Conexibacter sp. JD483]|uniref:hypothetical protein n=1 Tax=unclassified Conexibacter TaxID=2627773 RepID=UPI0027256FBC|nr:MULTISPECIES: hypothetical protein [unclassified Conexibacter]MDO8186920.1 hypothetical protein [Conexibacter sp. CPCC 205706]MDO8200625.1 hypothetical protein [Conexibacter sp. CPCC 205762]MDR9372924.1 hypothetical protein [Conexibacter sp. JD483]
MTFRRTTLPLLLALAAVLLAAPAASAHVYWTGEVGSGTTTIARADDDGRNVDAFFILPPFGARAIEVAGRKIYWIDDAGNIARADLDGSGVEQQWIRNAWAVRLAVSDDAIYWTSSNPGFAGSIGRADLDGGNANPFWKLMVGARDVAVDADHLYWARDSFGRVARARRDGSDEQLQFVSLLGDPDSIVVDDGLLLWADPSWPLVGRVPLSDPTPRSVWLSTTGADQLAARSGWVYWARADGWLGRARTTEPVSDVSQFWLFSGFDTITGLAADGRPGRPAIYESGSPGSVAVGTPIAPAITLDGGERPSGSATIALYDDATCSGTPLYSETVTVSGAGRYATAAYTPSRIGTYFWKLTYSGDLDNDPQESACGGRRLEVVKVAEGLTVSVHGDPVVGRPLHASVAWGPWTCAPSVRRAQGWGCLGGGGSGRAAAKSGTIEFALYGPADPSCRAAPRFTSVAAASEAGAQSEPFTPDAAGTWRWSASYSGDDLNQPFRTDCFEQTGSRTTTIAPAAPTLTVAPAPAGAAGVVVGAPLSATATLAEAYEPGGELTFALHGPGDETCATEPVFTGRAAVGGAAAPGDPRVVAAPAFAPTQPGRYRWAVSYPGDDRNDAAASGCGEPVELRARAVDPAPPSVDPPSPGPGAPAGPPPARRAQALTRFTLASRCVRPAASGGAVTVGLRLWTGRAGAVRVRVERALGTGGLDRCPPIGSPGRFAGRYRTVSVLRPAVASVAASPATAREAASTAAPARTAAAAGVRLRRATLRLRLAPALYRVTVTTGGVSKRRFLRVLAPRR